MKNKNKIVYSINIEDIQTVAVEEVERELTENEIEIAADLLGEKIDWYDAVLNSILEGIELNSKKKLKKESKSKKK